MLTPEMAGFMIAGSFGRHLAQTARDLIMEMARAPGPGARRLGRKQPLRFQGLAARQSLPMDTHLPGEGLADAAADFAEIDLHGADGHALAGGDALGVFAVRDHG